MRQNSLGNLWVRIILVLVIGWLLFTALFDTFTGRVPSFGPGNYINVLGGFGQLFFLISVQFLAITIFVVMILYLTAWLRDEYKFFKTEKRPVKKENK